MKTAIPQIDQLLQLHQRSAKIISDEQISINHFLERLALLELQLGPLNQLNTESLSSITEVKKTIHYLLNQMLSNSLNVDSISSLIRQLNNLQNKLKTIVGQDTDLSTLDPASDLIDQLSQENLSLQHVLLKQAEQLNVVSTQAKLIADITQQIKKAINS